MKTVTDSLTQRINSRKDSIEQAKNHVIDSIDNINKKISQRVTSVKTFDVKSLANDSLFRSSRRRVTKIDSARSTLQRRLDSLGNVSLSTTAITDKLDSLNKFNPQQPIESVRGKIDGAQNALNGKIAQPGNKVNDKIGVLSRESEGYGTLPTINSPAVDGVLPETPTLGLDNKLPATSLENPLPKLNVDAGQKLNLNKVNTDGLTDKLDNVSNVSENISGYADDARNISAGNLQAPNATKDLVEKLPAEQLKAAQGELTKGTEQIDALKALQNKQAFKEQTLQRASAVVIQQIAANQSKITESVGKISRYQRRAGSIFGKVKNLPKRARKEKKPPVIERFVPGLTFQLQKSKMWFLDLNPTVRYRVRSIFSVGMGWNERLVFDDNFTFFPDRRVYGVRSFYELSILKGLHLRADVERMNTFVPNQPTQLDIGERKYVWSYMAGIKKEFSFIGRVGGNVQFMYNLYDPKKQSPYFNRFNVRFGFDFPIKTKKSAPQKD